MDEPSRRRIGIPLLVMIAVLFITELVALATGRLTLAAACAAVLVVDWFVLRAWQKRR